MLISVAAQSSVVLQPPPSARLPGCGAEEPTWGLTWEPGAGSSGHLPALAPALVETRVTVTKSPFTVGVGGAAVLALIPGRKSSYNSGQWLKTNLW